MLAVAIIVYISKLSGHIKFSGQVNSEMLNIHNLHMEARFYDIDTKISQLGHDINKKDSI